MEQDVYGKRRPVLCNDDSNLAQLPRSVKSEPVRNTLQKKDDGYFG